MFRIKFIIDNLFYLVFPKTQSQMIVDLYFYKILNIKMSSMSFDTDYCKNITALTVYSNKHIKTLIHELKFNNNKKAAKFFADIFNDFFIEEYENIKLYHPNSDVIIIPIPLSKQRLKERGYNQVTRVLKQTSAKKFINTKILSRNRDTKKQSLLTKTKRKANIKDAFSAIENTNPDTVVLLVDDVVTTGATLEEARKTLKKSSYNDVYVIAFSKA